MLRVVDFCHVHGPGVPEVILAKVTKKAFLQGIEQEGR
jgi:hypothetical protein